MGKGHEGDRRQRPLTSAGGVDELALVSGHSEQVAPPTTAQMLLPLQGDHRPAIGKHGEGGDRDAFHEATRRLPGCTKQHVKLLYLISLHGRQARSRHEPETWIRKYSLMALVYEAIEAGVLEYDYAPEVAIIGKRRVWVNISQDARDDIDDLIAGKLVRELKMTTQAMQPVQSLQATHRGIRAAETAPAIMHRTVEGFAYDDGELLTARWAEREASSSGRGDGAGEAAPLGFAWEEEEDDDEDDEGRDDEEEPRDAAAMIDAYCRAQAAKEAARYGDDAMSGDGQEEEVPWWDRQEDPELQRWEVVCFIETASGNVQRPSRITQPEDISYVTSPHIPALLIDPLTQLQPLSDNSARAHESAVGRSTVRDASLRETLHLSGLELLVSEWLPWGANQVVALNERLGTHDHCKGGMFTSESDPGMQEGHMAVRTEAEVTTVKIIEAHAIDHINLEAEIYYPEEAGIVQVEAFGVHISATGGVVCGMRVESMMDRVGERYSLDLLARLLVDVQLDSSRIMATLLSQYQQSLLDVVYGLGDAHSRVKFNCVVARAISPKLQARNYMDGEERENELRQVLGQVLWARDLSVDDVIVLGTSGLLLAGPNVTKYDSFVTMVQTLLSLKIVVKAVDSRVLFVSQELIALRDEVESSRREPGPAPQMWLRLSNYGKTVELVGTCLTYMEEALAKIAETPLPLALQDPYDLTGRELLKALPHEEWREVLRVRVHDLQELIGVCRCEVAHVRNLARAIDTNRLYSLLHRIRQQSQALAKSSATKYRDGASLTVMLAMIAVSFSWRLLDRFLGVDLFSIDFGPAYPRCDLSPGGGGGEPCTLAEGVPTDGHEPGHGRWQQRLTTSLAGTAGLWGAVCVVWGALGCYLALRAASWRARACQRVVTVHAGELDARTDLRYLAVYLGAKRLDSSRIESVGGRDVKVVVWHEPDPFDPKWERPRDIVSWVKVALHQRAQARQREQQARLGPALGAAGTQQGQPKSSLSMAAMMRLKRTAAEVKQRAARQVGWRGLPPKIELTIDVDAHTIRDVSFTVDRSRRPDITRAELLPELRRLFLFHLENAGVVEAGTAAAAGYEDDVDSGAASRVAAAATGAERLGQPASVGLVRSTGTRPGARVRA